MNTVVRFSACLVCLFAAAFITMNTTFASESVRNAGYGFGHATVSDLVCTVKAVDSVLYGDTGYNPGEIMVQIKIENTGSEAANNVAVLLLSDTRFTVCPGVKTVMQLGTIPQGSVVDYDENDGFSVQAALRLNDGFDTLMVLVTADDMPPAYCSVPIFVEGVKRPVLDVQCGNIQLVYDALLDGYNPRPATLPVKVTNVGNATARMCQMIPLIPAGMVLSGMNSVQSFGDQNGALAPGDSVEILWQFVVLSGSDTEGTVKEVVFTATGVSGLQNVLTSASCTSQITVPPSGRPEYELVCSCPKVIYNANTSAYEPDPIPISVTVKNRGKAPGNNIFVRLDFPLRCYPASSETTERMISRLPVGQDTTVTWLMRPIAEPYEEVVSIGASAEDAIGISATCNTTLLLPEATYPELAISCYAGVGTLSINEYCEYAESPFPLYVILVNTSGAVVRDIDVSAICLSKGVSFQPQSAIHIDSLKPGESTGPLHWDVSVEADVSVGYLSLFTRTTASNIPSRICMSEVHIPDSPHFSLDCSLALNTGPEGWDDHVVSYVDSLGGLEGFVNSRGLHYFALELSVINTGTCTVQNPVARIQWNGNVMLMDISSPSQSFNGQMPPNVAGRATWYFLPLATDTIQEVEFTAYILDGTDYIDTCTYTLTIEAVHQQVDFHIPTDLGGKYGTLLTVPVMVQSSCSYVYSGYALNIAYDPDVLEFAGTDAVGTMTETDWVAPNISTYTLPGEVKPGIVRIQSVIQSSPVQIQGEGTFLNVLFRPVFGGDAATQESFITTDITFVPEFAYQGITLASELQSFYENELSVCSLNFSGGKALIGGRCVSPLKSAFSFGMKQNNPNPFSSTTTIRFTIEKETSGTLVVMDLTGMPVALLASGPFSVGEHSVVFDGADLPSGVYLVILETPDYVVSKRIILIRED